MEGTYSLINEESRASVAAVFVTSGRAQVAYDVTGDGGGDVLLIHAGVTDRRSWRAVVADLSGRHRCVAYDMRRYGETTYEPEPGWSPVADAVAVLDAAGVDRAVVVACSMGGAVAIELALTHPERVHGLVLIGTAVRGAPYPDITDEPAASLVAQAEAAEEAHDWDRQNELEATIWLDGPAAPGRVGDELRGLFLEMNGRALRAPDPGEPERPEAWSRLGELTMPVLVLVGSLDLSDIRAVDELLAQRLPQARFVMLDGVAHLPYFEGDPTCLHEIRGFVESLAPR